MTATSSTRLNADVLALLQPMTAVVGVRGVMLATAKGPIGAVEYAHLTLAVATDVGKTVLRLAVASAAANTPLRELLINFGPSRLMLRPVGDDVLVILLEREAETEPIRVAIDRDVQRLARVLRGEPAEAPLNAFGLDANDDDIGELLTSPLGPTLREIEAVYHGHRQRDGFDPTQIRALMHDQMREWLLCCNPSNYTLPLLLDGLAETMDEPDSRNAFVGDVQAILRRSGALR